MNEGSKKKDYYFSVIVPVYNEEEYIERCLRSLLDQDYPKELYEILAVDGGSQDKSMEIARKLAKSGRIRILQNPAQVAAAAINIGIRNSKGEVITRVDAHSYVEKNYLSSIAQVMRQTGEKVVGGPVQMVVDTPFRKASAFVLNSKLGVGSVPYRTLRQRSYVDSIQTGSYMREVLEKVGFFDETLPPGEDFDLNTRVRKAGYKILLDPTIKFHYFPRNSYFSLLRQYFHYGRVKPIVISKNPEAFRLKYIMPSMFCLYLTAILLSLFYFLLYGGLSMSLAMIAWLPLLLYILSALFISLMVIPRAGIRLAAIAFFIIPGIQISYGLGFIRGFFQTMKRLISKSKNKTHDDA